MDWLYTWTEARQFHNGLGAWEPRSWTTRRGAGDAAARLKAGDLRAVGVSAFRACRIESVYKQERVSIQLWRQSMPTFQVDIVCLFHLDHYIQLRMGLPLGLCSPYQHIFVKLVSWQASRAHNYAHSVPCTFKEGVFPDTPSLLWRIFFFL